MTFSARRRSTSEVLKAAALCAVAAIAVPANANAQTLTLKRELPDRDRAVCSTQSAVDAGLVTESDRSEAGRLAGSATQASIVGDHAGARDLLLRATRLDPEAGGVAYLLGRAYEELGSNASAMREYCRYLALTPDAPDASEVEARVSTLDPNIEPSLSEEAEAQFRRGLAAFDLGQLETAGQEFGSVIESSPRFADAYYNRGAVYAVGGDSQASIRDLRQYIELDDNPTDAAQVEAALNTLENPTRRYSAGLAGASSLFLPGVGQFYTGRSLAGTGFLIAAVGAVMFGELSEKVQIECRIPPTNGVCDPSNVVAETREKPYRAAGYGTAAAVALYAAIDAYRGARQRNGPAGGGLTVALGSESERSFSLPRLGVNPRGQVSVSLIGFSF
jgi:tetratricopeptide (TPR) repeat protein